MDRQTLEKLAHQFVVKAMGVREGQQVWVENVGPEGIPIQKSVVSLIESLGASAHVVDSSPQSIRQTFDGKSDNGLERQGTNNLRIMQSMDAYIRIDDEDSMLSLGLTAADYQRYKKLTMKDATQWRVKNTNWLVVSAPTKAMASQFGMSLPEFQDFYARGVLVDYAKMKERSEPLLELMGQKIMSV